MCVFVWGFHVHRGLWLWFVIVGGNWNNGGNVGFFYWNCNNASSNSNGNIGSRILYDCARFLVFFEYPYVILLARAKIEQKQNGLVGKPKNRMRTEVMKRYNNLYNKITDIENIKKAIVCASKGKEKRKSVMKILSDLDKHAMAIQEMLINKTYIPSPYETMQMYDSHRAKYRTLKKPKFYPDQCIHWALMLVCEPLFHKRMYKWSCSSIKGRGIHYAKDYVRGAMKDEKNTKYAYQLDIRHFYESVNNDRLKMKLRKMFKDEEVLWLFGKIIDTDKGLPIGNYTSQWLANFYLTDFDYFIKEKLKVKYYVRYADDCLMFFSNRRHMRIARKLIEEYLTENLLEIKKNWKTFKVSSRPIDYIGFQFYRDHVTLRDDLYLRIKRRAKKISRKRMTLNDARSMTSYWGYIINSDSHNFYMNCVKPFCDINKCKEIISNETY